MIHIKVVKKNDMFEKVVLKGHAGYANYGKDIVCAGVSSILTTTVNGILMLNSKAIEYTEENGNFILNISKKDETTQKLILNMISLFQELEQKYPKNIKVESEE